MTPIRSLDADDAPTCHRLAGDAVRLSIRQYTEEFARSDRTWVGVDGPAGLVAFAGRWDAPDVAHVLAVAVDRAHQRRGLGGALLDHLLHGAAAAGHRVAILEVHRDNDAAIGLYRSRGFQVSAERRHYYPDGDALVMTAHLSTRVA